MALAKGRIPRDSSMSSKVQTCVFDETTMKTTSLTTSHGVNKCIKSMFEEEDGSQSTNGLSNDSAITHSLPLCGSGNGYVYKSTSYQLEEAESFINNLMQGSDSLLNFQQSWVASNENNLHQGCYNQWNHVSPRGTTDLRLMQDLSCFQNASAFSSFASSAKEKQHGESSCGWLYSEESAVQESVLKKRSSMVLLPQLYQNHFFIFGNNIFRVNFFSPFISSLIKILIISCWVPNKSI